MYISWCRHNCHISKQVQMLPPLYDVSCNCYYRCLHKSGGALQYDPVTCAKFIGAAILLHNRCKKLNIPLPQVKLFFFQLDWGYCTIGYGNILIYILRPFLPPVQYKCSICSFFSTGRWRVRGRACRRPTRACRRPTSSTRSSGSWTTRRPISPQ